MKAQTEKIEWVNYHSMFMGVMPASIKVRLDLIESAPIKKYPYLLITRIPFKDNSKYGIAESKSTKQFLTDYNSELNNFLTNNYKAIPLGWIEMESEHIEYYMVEKKSDMQERLESFYNTKYPNLKSTTTISKDENWRQYTQVLILRYEIENSQWNQKIIQRFQEVGGNIDEKKLVDHSMKFTSEKGMLEFKHGIMNRGFKIEEEKVIDAKETYYRIKIWREELVSLANINLLTIRLKDFAYECGGKHEGWGVKVAKE